LRNFFLFVGAIALMVYTSPCCPRGAPCHSDYRAAACSLRPPGAQAVPNGTGYTRGGQRYAAESLAAIRVMQAFGAEPPLAAALARRGEAYAAARNAARSRAILTITVIFLVLRASWACFGWRARRSRSRMTGGFCRNSCSTPF